MGKSAGGRIATPITQPPLRAHAAGAVDPQRFGYQPALDGLRAVAVAMVVIFHGGFGWMSGGYVGVSVFFTLSGYLITSLLIVEHDRTGTISLAGFYSRRIRRLLPASLLTLVAVASIAAAGGFSGVQGVRRDLLGSLFQVENWVKLFGHASYADLTAATLGKVGPLEHYWSLAIEEQFYWIWPVAMLALLGITRRPGQRLIALIGGAGLGIVAAFVIADRWGPDAAYWAMPARLGEILVGAAIAAALARRTVPRWTKWLSWPALAAIVWVGITWPSRGGPAYEGWLAVLALATAALIIGLQHHSLLRNALSWRPMVWVGSVSYGIYLFHWPVLAWLIDNRPSMNHLTTFFVMVGITVVLAAISSGVVERPIRRWSPPPLRPMIYSAAGMAAVGVLVVAAVAVPAAYRPAQRSSAAGLDQVEGSLPPLLAATTTSSPPTALAPPALAPPALASTPAVPSTTEATLPSPATGVSADSASAAETPTSASSTPATLPVLSRPVRVLVVGDSTAEATGDGVVQWALAHPGMLQVTNDAVAGCGLLLEGQVPTDGAIPWKETCRKMLQERVPADITRLRPDVVMIMVTLRDIENRRFGGGSAVRTPLDADFADRLLVAYTAAADRFAAAGIAHIVWVLQPIPTAGWTGAQSVLRDPARYAVQFDVIRTVSEQRRGFVSVADLGGWLEIQGKTGDVGVRPDGLHLSPEAALWAADQFLVPGLIAAAVGPT